MREFEKKPVAPQASADEKLEPPPKKTSIPRVITKPPRFVIPLEGRMVDEGDNNVTLKCKIDGEPIA